MKNEQQNPMFSPMFRALSTLLCINAGITLQMCHFSCSATCTWQQLELNNTSKRHYTSLLIHNLRFTTQQLHYSIDTACRMVSWYQHRRWLLPNRYSTLQYSQDITVTISAQMVLVTVYCFITPPLIYQLIRLTKILSIIFM